MNKKKILVMIVLCIFCVGMAMGSASASHTFHKGKYKITISDAQYNKIKKLDGYGVSKKVGTVKKTKWVTKKIKTYETWINSKGELYKSKSWNPYKKVGYDAKYVRSVTKYYSDGDITWDYFKVKKTVKKPVYLGVWHDSRSGNHKIHTSLYYSNPGY